MTTPTPSHHARTRRPLRRHLKRVSLAAITTGTLLSLATGLHAYDRERRVLAVRPGVPRAVVTRLLGDGAPSVMAPLSGGGDASDEQRAFRGNPSLWYGRFEDTLVVRFAGGRVSGVERIGL